MLGRAIILTDFTTSTAEFQLGCSQTFRNSGEIFLLLFWTARENAVTILTLALLGTIVVFFIKTFFNIKLKQLGTKTRFAL